MGAKTILTIHCLPRIHLRRCLPLLWLVISLVQLGLVPKPVHAHGGFVIDSGYTPQYEWLAAINPYPTTPGPTTITILVYDVQTHQPVNELQAEILLAAPVAQSLVANKVSTMVLSRCSQIQPFTLVTIQLLWR